MVRVLLVDDAEPYRRLVAIHLKEAGIDVVGEASDGEGGVRLAAKLKPDVVLLDLAMPVMDGYEALPLIREAAPRAKVVILTGFEAARVKGRVRELGAHGCLEKGISGRDLAAAVRRVS